MNTKQLKAKVLDLAIHGKLLSPETVADLKKSPDYETADILLEKIRKEKEEKIAKGELKRDKKDSYIFVGDDNRHYEKFADGTVKDIEDEIPFEVPEGWEWTKIRCVSSEILYGVSESAKESGKYRLLRITDIQDDKVDWESVPFTDFPEDKVANYILKNGDIVFARTGATVGKSYLIEKLSVESIYASYLIRIRTSQQLNPKYIKYFFGSLCYWNQITDKSSGIGQPNVNWTSLANLYIPIPPYYEQGRILPAIEKSFAQIDSLEKDKSDLQTAIKQAKSKILDLAIRGKLVPQDSSDEPASVLLERLREEKEAKIKAGELKRDKNDSYIYKSTTDNCYYQRFADGHEEDISEEIPCELPESWAWCRIKDICTINPKNKLDDNLEVSFIPMTLIDAGYTNHHGQETRVWKKIKTGFTHFAENDVAIAKISPCFENKKSAILQNLKNGYGAGTTELYILRACSIVLPEYLFWIVKTDSFINEGVGNFSGVVGQQRLARDIVENYYIPLPPIKEQKRIVDKILAVFEKLDCIENNIE